MSLPPAEQTQPALPSVEAGSRCAACKKTFPPPADRFCPFCGWYLEQEPPSAQGLGARRDIGGVVIALQLSAAEQWKVAHTPFLIGRDQGDLRFPDDLQLSRLHAALLYREGQLYVRDLDSRNGTILGDRRLPASEDIPVVEGEHLRLGNKDFTIVFHGDEGRLDAYGKAYSLKDAAGQQWRLRPGENIIGRDDHAHVRLTASEAVSRQHATLKLADDFGRFRIELRDEKSANGTFLNDEKVLPLRWVQIEVGDRLRFGDVEVALQVEQLA